MSLRRIALPYLGLLVAASVAVGQTEDFYEARLAEGFANMSAQRVPEAIDQLRIASFGLMDRPVLLTEALVRLALAQEVIASKEAVVETVTRFVEVERRFGSFATTRLESGARTAFRNLLARHVPKSVMDSLPSFGSPPPSPLERQIVSEKTPLPQPEPVMAATPTAAPERNAPPRFRTRILPEYPPDALKAGTGGVVLLNVLVSETGAPLQIEVLREVRPDLAQAAVSAVKRWTFEPARKDGVPVRASLTVPINFQAPAPTPTPRAP